MGWATAHWRRAVRPPQANAYKLKRDAWPDRTADGVAIASVSTMNDPTFRNLPLTPEQDSEIRHYIHTHERRGEPWDTPELAAMLADMLDPPEVVGEDAQARDDSIAAERTTAEHEEPPGSD